jgi:hypothetical protein
LEQQPRVEFTHDMTYGKGEDLRYCECDLGRATQD